MRLVSLLLFCISLLEASYLHWYSDYELAHQEALKQDKSLLILLVEKKNTQLINENFINKTYIDEINREFISVYIVKNQKLSYPIELLYTLEYPTLFFLNKYELYSCDALSGEINPELLSKKLKECY